MIRCVLVFCTKVCPFDSVRQYHKEVDGSRTEISLGSPKTDGALVLTEAQVGGLVVGGGG